MGKTMIEKAAEEQEALGKSPIDIPDSTPAAQPATETPGEAAPAPAGDDDIITGEDGLTHAQGHEGGFSAPAPKKKAPTADQDVIAELQARITSLEAGGQPVQPAQTAEPPPQQPQQPQQQGPELPESASLGKRGAVIFGDPGPAAQPPPQQPQQPRTQPPPQPAPQQQQQPPPQQQSLSKQGLDGVQVGDNYVYIGKSALGPGHALVLDNVSRAELDTYSWMIHYLKETYPDSIPIVHPAVLLKYSLNHLLFQIRKDTAQFAVCSQCNTQFDIMELNCPNCNFTNRCPACNRLHGDNSYR